MIEPKTEHLRLISQFIKEILPDTNILAYKSLANFQMQLKKEHVGEKSAAPTDPQPIELDKISLIVADSEDSTRIPLPVWKKFMDLLASKSAGKELPKLILTGYEQIGSHKDVEKYIGSFVFNLLIKPFDPLLAKQIFQIALKKPGTIKPEGIFTQEGKGLVEIIKDIEMSVLTELGFRTSATREIPIGRRARYFGKCFEGPGTNSVFAYSYKNTETPKGPKNFASSFSFLGVAREQLAAIRRLINENKSKEKLPFQKNVAPKQQQMFLFSKDGELCKKLGDLLTSKFSSVDSRCFFSLSQFVQHLPSDKLSSLGKELAPTSLFPKSGQVQLSINKINHRLLEVFAVNEKKNDLLNEFIGFSFNDIKDKDFVELVTKDESKEVLLKWLSGTATASDGLLCFESKSESQVYCRVVKREEPAETPGLVKIFLQELTHSERAEYIAKQSGAAAGAPSGPSAVFVDLQTYSGEIATLRSVFQQLYAGTKISFYALEENAIKTYEQLAGVEGFDDVFQIPFDVFYLSRKLKMHDESLEMKSDEENFRYSVNFSEHIFTAMPVQMTSISEVHLSLNYQRELQLGDVRRFILWIPNTVHIPEIYGVCRYCEKAADGGFKCDFLFFGVHEQQLKYIRKWILEEHVHKKAKEA